MESKRNGVLVGTGVREITPATGADMAGSIGRVVSTGVAAPLYARSMMIVSNGKKLVFCSVDVIMIPNDILRSIVRRVGEKLGIPDDSVMIGATHTHNGPVIRPLNDESIPAGEAYERFLEDQIIGSIEAANGSLVPARIGIGVEEESSLVFNRRLKRPDGRIAMNFSQRTGLRDFNADGPVDPDIFLIQAEDEAGNPLGLIVNYPLHNNAGGGKLLHPDISGFLERQLQSRLKTDVPLLFFAGASGDVNWIDFRKLHQVGGMEEANRIAGVLADRLLLMRGAMTMRDEWRLDSIRETVSIPERPLLQTDYTDDGCFGESPAFSRFYAQIREQLAGRTEWPVHTFDITAFRIGDTVWISNPAELFVGLGLLVKNNSPFGAQKTCLCTLTNGFAGYVPTAEAFEEGGYEVKRTLYTSFLDTGAGALFVEKSLRLCGKLYVE